MSSNSSSLVGPIVGAIATAVALSAATAAVTAYFVNENEKSKQLVPRISKQESLYYWNTVIANGPQAFKRNKRTKEILRQQGIPPHLRSLVWPLLSKSYVLQEQHPDEYQNTLAESERITTVASEQIDKDLARTFPEQEFFKKPAGLESLRRILIAFSIRHKEIGYCQSMNFVCGCLLLADLTEEQSFWMMETIFTRLLPPDFYSESLSGLKKDLVVLDILCATELPRISQHLKKLDIALELFVMPWFLCLFINAFSLPLSMRFLDCLMYEGSKALFRVSLGLLKLHEQQLLRCSTFWDGITLCKSLPTSPLLSDFNDLFQPDWDLGEISTSRIDALRASVNLEQIKNK